MSIMVSRAINGDLSIHGNEYLLDDHGNLMIFDDEEKARKFLSEDGLGDHLDSFNYEETRNISKTDMIPTHILALIQDT